eukprot:comp4955_c0_seq1/m.1048 comp4955_c0_seq1/g.1048  ORF comp4955_c0_seq1/g.1048 comp4955_c0_seq1/m.1048 type:complete len:461 (-) comp4955_c0_seq1:324-1706(-)
MEKMAPSTVVLGDSTMLKTLLREGSGSLDMVDKGKATFHFRALLPDGTVIDDSRRPGWTPFDLRLGKKFILDAWEATVKTMKLGEVAQIQCDASRCAAYPQLALVMRRKAKKVLKKQSRISSDSPVAPPPNNGHGIESGNTHNDMLSEKSQYETPSRNEISPEENFHSTTSACPIVYESEKGDHGHSPSQGDSCTHSHTHSHTHSQGHSNCKSRDKPSQGVDSDANTQQHQHEHEHEHDSEDDEHSCCGVTFADTMKRNPDLLQLAGKSMLFEFEMISYEPPGEFEREFWELSLEEKREAVPKLREEGNNLYRSGDYQRAFKSYGLALSYLDRLATERDSFISSDAERVKDEKAKALRLPVLLNHAACALKLSLWDAAIDSTTSALSLDAKNTKALFRRAQAQAAKGWDIEKATEDLKVLLAVEPANGEARKELARVEAKIRANRERERRTYTTLFKFSG